MTIIPINVTVGTPGPPGPGGGGSGAADVFGVLYVVNADTGSTTDAAFGTYPSGSRLILRAQANPSENGVYLTDGTTTLVADPTFPVPTTTETLVSYSGVVTDWPSTVIQAGGTAVLPSGFNVVDTAISGGIVTAAVRSTLPGGYAGLLSGALTVDEMATVVDSLSVGSGALGAFQIEYLLDVEAPLTDSFWAGLPVGNRVVLTAQTNPSENGVYLTDGTATLVTDPSFPVPTTSKTLIGLFQTVGDWPPTQYIPGSTSLVPAGFDVRTDYLFNYWLSSNARAAGLDNRFLTGVLSGTADVYEMALALDAAVVGQEIFHAAFMIEGVVDTGSPLLAQMTGELTADIQAEYDSGIPIYVWLVDYGGLWKFADRDGTLAYETRQPRNGNMIWAWRHYVAVDQLPDGEGVLFGFFDNGTSPCFLVPLVPIREGGSGVPEVLVVMGWWTADAPLTDAFWGTVPAGLQVLLTGQTNPAENGFKLTDGTTTLVADPSVPTGPLSAAMAVAVHSKSTSWPGAFNLPGGFWAVPPGSTILQMLDSDGLQIWTAAEHSVIDASSFSGILDAGVTDGQLLAAAVDGLTPAGVPIGPYSGNLSGTSNLEGALDYLDLLSGSGLGDVVGPASATDNAVARFDTTTGRLIQDSSATIADDGVLSAQGLILPNLTLPLDGSILTDGTGAGTAGQVLTSAGSGAPVAWGDAASGVPEVMFIAVWWTADTPLTNAIWGSLPAGFQILLTGQTNPSENGFKVTDGTTTLAVDTAVPTGALAAPMLVAVGSKRAAFPGQDTPGGFWVVPQGWTVLTALDAPVLQIWTAAEHSVIDASGFSGILDAGVTDGQLLAAAVDGLGSLAALSTITSSEITDDTIVDADINSAAAIALSKLAITGTPDGDHFLRDDGTWATIVDAAVDASAAIALSKLAITGTPDGTKFLRDDGTWEAVPGGGGGTWTLISDSTLGVAAAAMAVTVTGYQVVRFTWLGRTSVSSGSDTLAVRFNADATAKYSSKGAALSTSGTLGIVPGALTNTNRLGIVEGQFALGATGLYTIGRSWGARVNSNGTLSASDDNWISWSGSLTAAATSMSFFPIGGPNLAAGSRLIVEGII